MMDSNHIIDLAAERNSGLVGAGFGFDKTGGAYNLLREHNQYVGRSLKMNGPFWWDTYKIGGRYLEE